MRIESAFEPGIYVSPRGHVYLGAGSIGTGTVIHERVSIGWGVRHDGTPTIGANVWIGPDTVISGHITVGEGTTILPRTVLARSVPANSLVEGNPGHVIRRGFDNSALRQTRSTDPGRWVDAPDGG